MSWDEQLFAVFDDLESEAAAAFDRERDLELADRRRSEYAAVTLAGRLMASVGGALALDVVGVGSVQGRLDRVARGWCLVAGERSDWIVPLAAVAGVEGASRRAVPEVAWPAVARLGLGSALRRLADSAQRCVVHGRDGRQRDGVVQRVGADFVELVTGEPSRTVLVALPVIAAVQSLSTD